MNRARRAAAGDGARNVRCVARLAGYQEGAADMVVRSSRPPGLSEPSPPKRRQMRTALYVALLAVAGAAVFIGVQVSGPSRGAVVAIPAPPAVTIGAAAEQTAASPAKASPAAQPSPHALLSPGPVAGAQYAGRVLLNAAGAQLASWNQTSSYCTQEDWEVPDGSVYKDRSDDAVLATTGKDGSCVALISPGAYSSAVVEAYVYFPPLPGHPGTIANWTSIWLTNQAAWPADGELDAVEAEPATGVNAVAWHWGSAGDEEQSMSTDGYAQQGTLPRDGPNLTPGWHLVDIAYTQGFFAVYYDGKLFSTLSSGTVTGSALNVLITTGVTPDNSEVEQTIGTAPVNSDSSPAGMAVKYVKIWAFK